VRVLLRGRTAIEPGQSVHLVADPGNIHAFSRGSGEALSS
jgi:hypothetical protein